MTLDATLKKLYARRRFGVRPGIERVQLLLERLGNPQHDFKTIHVVGTNGKGSTSAFLSSILGSAGYRTALFTSPHLVDFTERFRIDGQKVSPVEIQELLAVVLSSDPNEATFFEIITALSALLFSRKRVDVAVIEAGMGGRSDATAAFPGIMTVITPISLDHCDYLGKTITAIAEEKCAIAEPGTPVVCSVQPVSALDIIVKQCRLGNNPLIKSGRDFTVCRDLEGTLAYGGLKYQLDGISIGISGRYQSENAAVALAAAETAMTLGYDITAGAMTDGIKHAYWPGRMEVIAQQPLVILDGAHNPDGMSAMIDSLVEFTYRRLYVVLGIMQDKQVDEMLALLKPHVGKIYAVTPAVDRALPSQLLVQKCHTAGIRCEDAGTVINGLEMARRHSDPDDLVMVCGSLFVVGEVKAHQTGTTFKGIRG